MVELKRIIGIVFLGLALFFILVMPKNYRSTDPKDAGRFEADVVLALVFGANGVIGLKGARKPGNGMADLKRMTGIALLGFALYFVMRMPKNHRSTDPKDSERFEADVALALIFGASGLVLIRGSRKPKRSEAGGHDAISSQGRHPAPRASERLDGPVEGGGTSTD